MEGGVTQWGMCRHIFGQKPKHKVICFMDLTAPHFSVEASNSICRSKQNYHLAKIRFPDPCVFAFRLVINV